MNHIRLFVTNISNGLGVLARNYYIAPSINISFK